jgi:ATP-dependent Clp protease ATP-binding subunit ClpC
MFERFSAAARRVVATAYEEARTLNHDEVGPEHILIGLIHEREGVAAKVLDSLGISQGAMRRQVQGIAASEHEAQSGRVGFGPRSQKVFEGSLHAAQQLGQYQIGTPHLLLGIIRSGDGAGAQALTRAGVDLTSLELQLVHRLQNERDEPASAGEQSNLHTHLSGPHGYAVSERVSTMAEAERLHAEVSRLQALLRQYGIDPGVNDGATPEPG